MGAPGDGSKGKWITEGNPTEIGYYLVYYFNKEEDKFMYKALVYDVENSKWCVPRPNFPLEKVIGWWDVRYDYYVPCQMQSGVISFPI